MSSVRNEHGIDIDFDFAVQMMDDDIRESVHADLVPCSKQAFFDEYVKRHAEKYGKDDWQPAQANPVI